MNKQGKLPYPMATATKWSSLQLSLCIPA